MYAGNEMSVGVFRDCPIFEYLVLIYYLVNFNFCKHIHRIDQIKSL